MPSSVIQIMSYDPQVRVVDIVYRAGRGTYRYFDVSAAEWATFRTAGSKGTHLNEVFKEKHPRYAKLTEGEGMSRKTPGVEWWA